MRLKTLIEQLQTLDPEAYVYIMHPELPTDYGITDIELYDTVEYHTEDNPPVAYPVRTVSIGVSDWRQPAPVKEPVERGIDTIFMLYDEWTEFMLEIDEIDGNYELVNDYAFVHDYTLYVQIVTDYKPEEIDTL